MHVNNNKIKDERDSGHHFGPLCQNSLFYTWIDILLSMISAVEQQSLHDTVPQAVLQCCGEQRVADHIEVTIHLCSVGQQQLHQVVPGNGQRARRQRLSQPNHPATT